MEELKGIESALVGYEKNKPFSWLSKEQKESVYMAGYGGIGKTHVMLDLALEAEKARGKDIPKNIIFHEEGGPIDHIQAHMEAIQKAREDFIKCNSNPCMEIIMGTGGECALGEDFESLFYEPNKMLLIC